MLIQGVRQSGWRHEPGSYKACPNEAVTAFCVFTSTLFETVLVLFGVVCQYSLLVMASTQQQAFRMCVHPCLRYLTGGDTHILCVACLGEEHAWSALESFPCRNSSHSPGLWSCFCRGTAKAAVRGFAKGSFSRGRHIDGVSHFCLGGHLPVDHELWFFFFFFLHELQIIKP